MKIYTCEVDENSIKETIDDNLLPIFIEKELKYSYIEKWNNTSIHLKELSPPSELILLGDTLDFKIKYLLELSTKISLSKHLSKLSTLITVSNSEGIVLFYERGSLFWVEILSDLLERFKNNVSKWKS